MSKVEHNNGRDYRTFALTNPGKPPENAHRFPPRGLQDTMSENTAHLGWKSEAIFHRWCKWHLSIPTEEQAQDIIQTRQNVIRKIAACREETRLEIERRKMDGETDQRNAGYLRYLKQYDPYQRLAYPIDSHQDDLLSIPMPGDVDLRHLFDLVDSILRTTHLREVYEKLPSSSGVVAADVKYLVLTALSLAKEIAEPTFSLDSRTMSMDIRLHVGKKFMCQFDAMRTSEKSLLYHCTTSEFHDYFRNLQKKESEFYELFEVKTVFRERGENNGALKKPVNEHVVDAQVKLLQFAIWWKNTGKGLFPLPSKFHLVYLRPFEQTIVHALDIKNPGFLEAWTLKLEVLLPRVADGQMRENLQYFIKCLRREKRLAIRRNGYGHTTKKDRELTQRRFHETLYGKGKNGSNGSGLVVDLRPRVEKTKLLEVDRDADGKKRKSKKVVVYSSLSMVANETTVPEKVVGSSEV